MIKTSLLQHKFYILLLSMMMGWGFLHGQTATAINGGAAPDIDYNGSIYQTFCLQYYQGTASTNDNFSYDGSPDHINNGLVRACLNGMSEFGVSATQYAIWYFTDNISPASGSDAWTIINRVNSGEYEAPSAWEWDAAISANQDGMGMEPVDALNCTGNIVSNASFENGSTGWTFLGGATTSNTTVNSGSFAAFLDLAGDDISQQINLSEGDIFNASAYVINYNTTSDWVGFGIDFFDANNNLIKEFNQTINYAGTFQQYAFTGIAPAGTVSAEIWFYRGASTNGNVYIDDVCVVIEGSTKSGGEDNLSCPQGQLVSGTKRFIKNGITNETLTLPAIITGDVAVSVFAVDEYSGRQNITQNNEQVKVQFLSAGNVVAETGFTTDLPDMVVRGESNNDFGTISLGANVVDQIKIVHSTDPNANYPGTLDNSPNSLEGVEICIISAPPCEGKTVVFDNPLPTTVTGNNTQTINYDNIGIAGLSNLTLTATLSSDGNLDGTGGSNSIDWIDIYYTIDNGTEVKIANQNRDYGDCGPDNDDNDINPNNYDQSRTLSGVGNCTTDWIDYLILEDIPNIGTEIDIRIEINVTGTNESITLDDLSICGLGQVNACVGGYGLTYQRFEGINGSSVNDLINAADFPDNPTVTNVLTNSDAPDGIADSYGTRIRGFIAPSENGEYQFNITSDDSSEFRWSLNDLPENAYVFASVNGFTGITEYTKFSSQTSRTVELRAGNKYYIEILHKEGSGGDHVQLYWKTPSNSNWHIIPNNNLRQWACGNEFTTTTPLDPGDICPSGDEVFTIDFDTDDDGNTLVAGTDNVNTNQPYENLFAPGLGVSLMASNPTDMPLNLYNSNGSGGMDSDLERGAGWNAGNIDGDFGNLLIINETSNIAVPDDNGGGGTVTIDFDLPLVEIAFDFVDLQVSEVNDNGGNDDFLRFTDTNTGQSTIITFIEFQTGSGSTFETTAIYGDRTANRVTGITATELGLSSFDKVEIVTNSTYGIGTICVKPLCELVVDLGPNEEICEGESITLTAAVTGEVEGGSCVFQEDGGTVVMEAENYSSIDDQTDVTTWETGSDAGAVGGTYMTTATGSIIGFGSGTKMTYDVNITTAANYTLYVRRRAPATGDNSTWGAFNGVSTNVFDNQNIGTAWVWVSLGTANLSAGANTVEIVRRERGYQVDRLVVTTGAAPTGNGPAESACNASSSSLTYAWSTGANTPSITVTPTTNTDYSVTVTDAINCTASDVITVNVKPKPNANIPDKGSICSGESVTFEAPSNPNGTTYSWDFGANADPAIISGPGPHIVTYNLPNNQLGDVVSTVTLTATLNGCIASDDATVSVRDLPEATASKTDPTCGDANGTITFTFPNNPNKTQIGLSIDGGNSYTEVNDNIGSFTFDNLAAGTYDLAIRWGNETCPVDIDDVTLVDQGAPDVNAGENVAICTGGMIDLTATVLGGTAPITYTWMPGNLTGQTIQVNPTVTTTYTVTAADQNGCTDSDQVVVTVVPDPAVSIVANENDICEGGSVTLTAMPSGGLDCDDVQWQRRTGSNGNFSNVGTGNTYNTNTSLSPGTYQYRARLHCGGIDCGTATSSIVTVTIVADPNVDITIDETEVCFGETTDLTAMPSGGLNCSSVQWQRRTGTSGNFSNIATGNTYTTSSNLAAGTYQYRAVYDCSGTGCGSDNSDIVTLVIKPNPNAHVSNQTICSGESITFEAPNNPSGTTYTWDFGANANPATAMGAGPFVVTYTLPANQIGNGSATVTLTATLNGCVDTDDAHITIRDTPEATITSTDPTCGDDNGTITFTFPDNPDRTTISLSINGGTNFTGRPDNSGSFIFDGLGAGTYDLVLKWGNNECEVDIPDVTLVDQGSPTLSSTITDVKCNGENTGAIDLTVNGGSAPFTFAWSNGATTEDISNVAAGTYAVTVTDNNDCEAILSNLVIEEPTAINLSTVAIDVKCNGDATGGIDLTVMGGTPPYSYAWSNSATTEDLSGITAGTYTVTVIDDNDCTAIISETVEEPTAIILSSSINNADCKDEASGSIDLTVNGGTGPYTFEWSNGETTEDISMLPAGTYAVTVEDANNCTAVLNNLNVGEPTAITLSAVVTNVKCNGESNASINVSVNGGTPPYQYAWSNSATTQDLSNVSAGTYTLTVTDNNGCTETIERTIEEPAELTVSTGPDQQICTGETTTIPTTVLGGTMPYTYAWNTGATTPSLTNVGGGTYTVTVTDANMCTATSTTVVTESSTPNVEIVGPNAVCPGEPVTFKASPNISGATYTWTFNGASPSSANGPSATVTYNNAGNFTIQLSITTVDNCSGSTSTTVVVRDPVDANAGANQSICEGGSTTLDGSSSTASNYMWTVVSGDMNSIDSNPNMVMVDVSPTETTTYLLTVKDASGECTDTDQVTVTIDPELNPTANAGIVQAGNEFCTGDLVTLDASASTAPAGEPSANLNYTWFDADPAGGANSIGSGVTLDVNPNTTTEYFVIVSVNGGSNDACADTAAVTVNVIKCADLNLTKVVNNSEANVGQNVIFTIKVCNDGPDNATGVQVTDQLPDGYEYVTSAPLGQYNPTNGLWTIGNVDVNTCKMLTITATVKESGDYVNIASITAANENDVDSTPNNDPDTDNDGNIGSQDDGDPDDEEDPNDEDDADDAEVAPSRIDLNLIKVVDNATPNVGENVTFTITVCNDGPDNATGIKVTDELPSGYDFVSALPNGQYNSNTGIWTVGSLSNGLCKTLTITATVQSNGDYTNIASVTDANEFDIDSEPGNDPDTNENGNIGSQDDGDPNDEEDPDDEDDADDATVMPQELGAIGNYVWFDEDSNGLQDEGENGIPNVIIILKDENGNEIDRTLTDSDGGYLFADLPAGRYFVDVDETTLPNGFTQTDVFGQPDTDLVNQNHDGNGYLVNLNPGEENLTADFGYNSNPTDDVDDGENTASLGDRVWIDSDGDGVQDPAEIGVAEVEITLTGAGDDGIFGTPDDVTATTTTDENGFYLFDGLAPGAYMTEVTDDNGASHDILGNDYTQTGDPDDFGALATMPDNKQTDAIILGPGDVFLNSDYGYQPANNAPLGSIGNTIWLDADADSVGPNDVNGDAGNGAAGTPDNEEEPIEGVTVALIADNNGNGIFDAGDEIIGTDVTDENGQYLFEDLPLNEDYIVWVNDTENVLDGLENTYDADGGAGMDTDGFGDDADMVGGLSAVTLDNSNTDDVLQDFGYTPIGQDEGEGIIGDYVWFDEDRDGMQDPEEQGIEGVIVELLDDMGNVIATTTTDENGNYYFGNLPVDNDGEQYQVVIADENFDPSGVLEGLENTFDPDGDEDNEGALITLTTANPTDLDQDFGYAGDDANTLGSIGDTVFEDTDADGIKDANEPGIEGVTLDLYRDLDGDGELDPGEPLIGSATTGANGEYLFEELPLGDYIVDVTDEDGILAGFFHSVSPNQDATTNGGDDPMDNSKDDAFAVEIGNGSPVDNRNVDFGYYKDGASVGNYVWVDSNANGLQDDGETGINGVEVTLVIEYPNGDEVTVVTETEDDASGNPGFYDFANLLLDEDYNMGAMANANSEDLPLFTISVEENQPELASFTPTLTDVNNNGNDLEDSDDFGGVIAKPVQGNNNTDAFDPATNEDVVASYDFGVIEGLGAIGNYVWFDEDSNGLQDEGEVGIPNVVIILKDENGTEIARTVTDSDGGYLFPNLPAGSYFVDVEETSLPNGLTQTDVFGQPDTDLVNQNHDGVGYPINLSPGEENLTADFGYNSNPTDDVDDGENTASIGDRVWIDSDGDGVQDPEEVGVEGVQITLMGAGDDGIFGTPDDVTETTTTDENGFYLFDDLAPGAYMTEVTNDNGANYEVLNTTDYTQTGDPDDFGELATMPDNKQTDPIILGPGDVYLNSDYGYQPTSANNDLSAIGDYVWFDADADGSGPAINGFENNGVVVQGNNNGTADPAENGIAGVTVALIRDDNDNGVWDANEPIIATDVTNEDGFYYFPDLIATPGMNDYIIWVSDTDNVLDGLKPTYDQGGGAIPTTSGAPFGIPVNSILGISTQDLGTSNAANATRLAHDFGYTPIGQDTGEGVIGDYVWFDEDGDGVQDDEEEGIEGVVVALEDADGNVIATTTTDENGAYYFGGLPVDDDGEDYKVVIADENFFATGVLSGLENTFDPDGDNDNEGDLITLTTNDPINLDQDFGYVGDNALDLGSIGNLVWEDTNADGIKDADEEGFEGVTLDLYKDINGNGQLDPNEPLFASTTTDMDGMYLFGQLPLGNYIVDVTDEDGVLAGYFHSVSPNQDATTNNGNDPMDNSKDDAFAVTIGSTIMDNLNVDFGYYKDGASVGNYVWEDINNNGLQDDGETGINGVQVSLVIEYPNGTEVTVVTETEDDANGNPGFYDFANLLLDEDYNMGAMANANSEDLPLFTISVDEDQTALDGFLTTQTDVGGNTNDLQDSDDFAGVIAKPIQGNNNTQAVDPATNEDVVASYDFGVVRPAGSIGNFVWFDEDSNGLQDAGEPGIPNVLIILKDENGNPIDSTLTDFDGGYLFSDIPAGDYFVDVDETTLPDGLTQTDVFGTPGEDLVNQSHDGNGYPVTLEEGDENLTADFGYNSNPTDNVDDGEATASIGDRVWIDSDGDGVQDPEEVGVSGVEVTLTGAGDDGIFGTPDDITATTTTDENGNYLFDNLVPGAYMTEVTDDNGASHDILGNDYTQTGDPDDFGELATMPDNKQTEPIILGPGDVYLNSDYGYQPENSAPLGSIGNTIWLDADADGVGPDDVNGDGGNGAPGTADNNEEPIEGVTVALIADNNGNGVFDAGDEIIGTDVTDENGQYLFEDLPLDEDYLVWVNDTDNVLEGLENTYDQDGGAGTDTDGFGDDADMVGGLSAVTLDNTNTDDTAQDFGYTPQGQDEGEGIIGDYVWFDEDRDGMQDDDEEGIEGVIVELLDDMSNVIATTTTDENGNYYFGGLPLDENYQVVIADENFFATGVLSGLENTADPDGDDDNEGALITLTSTNPTNLDQDFGYVGDDNLDLGSIGNLIWEDDNADGMKDADEEGIEGVTLDLYKDINGNGQLDSGEPLFASTVTDMDGMYLFDQLPLGNYIVDVTDEDGVLAGYFHSVSPNQDATTNNGNDPMDNSKDDAFAVTIGSSIMDNLNVDFGYYKDGAAVGNYVWEDVNANGLQDDGETGLNGVEVTLVVTYPNGDEVTVVTETENDANGNPGFYEFTNLLLDEDYNMGAMADAAAEDLPLFTISVAEDQPSLLGLVPTTADVNGNANDLEDSDPFDGVVAKPVQGNNSTEAIDPETDENVVASYDFGVTEGGAIGNYVWLDEDSNGLQDEGEVGIPNVVIILKDADGNEIDRTLTDSDGGYLFTDLPAGEYFVDVDETTLPDGLTQTDVFGTPDEDLVNQSHDGNGYPVDLDAGEENLTADFGYNYNPTDDVDGGENTAALGDRVWIDSDGDGVQDPEEVGVSGVEITLTYAGLDGKFNTGDDTMETTTTDENGFYIFDDLVPGVYMTEVTDDNGASHDILGNDYTQTGDPDDFGEPATMPDNKQTSPIILAPGDVFLNSDYGYQPDNNAPLGSIGNTIWLDADADGVGPNDVNADSGNGAAGTPDNNEEPIQGVTVALIADNNGNGVFDTGDEIIGTDVTDENGQYLFEDLPLDEDYIVWVNDTDNVLDGLSNTYDADGGAGMDTDGLGDAADMVGGLSAVTLDNSNTDDTIQDFGYTPAGQEPGEGAIGDYVWFDEDRDGVQDPDEEGIEGVIVELEDGMGNVIATTTTDENGNYYFGGLPLDEDYQVVIASENFFATGVLSGLESTFEPDGDNDNEGDVITLTTANPVDLDQDFGYTGNDALTLGSIGNLVWEDTDADGIKDADEEGFADVTLDLYRDINGNGRLDASEPLFASTTTDMNGAYLFDQLPLGAYIVDVTDDAGVLVGYFHSTSPNQDANTNMGNDPMDNSKDDAFAVTIGSSIPNNLNVDFGYYKDPAALGNFVWNDLNGNGLQDVGEPGIEGVDVTLEITYPNGDMTTVIATTDANGFYEFPNLLLDEDYNGQGADQPVHIISVETPVQDENNEVLEGFVPTNADVGMNDLIDSDDINGVLGLPVQGNENTAANADPALEDPVASYDFGFSQLELVGIGGTLFDDRGQGGGKFNDGAQNGTEPGLPGVLVVLLDSNGNEVDRTVTDADGNYLFTGLTPGNYQVQVPSSNFVTPTNPLATLPFSSVPTTNVDDDTDNDDNGIQLTSQGDVNSPIINLSPGNEPSGAQEFQSPNQDGSENSTQDVNTNTTIDFGFQDLVLPVELLSFKAQANKDHIDLVWVTASERNNSHFELERSEDGKTFKQIARIEGNGTTIEEISYAYEDLEVVANVTYYYRLKQVDFDGNFDYSDIRTAQIEAEASGEMSLYPNPVGMGEPLNVRIFLQELSTELYVLDLQGRILKTVQYDVLDKGWNIIEVQVDELAAGTYFLASSAGEIKEFIKIE